MLQACACGDAEFSYLGQYAKHALGEVTQNFMPQGCFQSPLDGEIACASDSIGKFGNAQLITKACNSMYIFR